MSVVGYDETGQDKATISGMRHESVVARTRRLSEGRVQQPKHMLPQRMISIPRNTYVQQNSTRSDVL